MKINKITQKRSEELARIMARSRRKVGIVMFRMPNRKWKTMMFSQKTSNADLALFATQFGHWMASILLDFKIVSKVAKPKRK